MSENLKEYIQREICKGDTWRKIADAIDGSHSTLLRQIEKNELPVTSLVAICRSYGHPLGEAFVQAGYITEAESLGFNGPAALHSVTDAALTAEITRRLMVNSNNPTLTSPLQVADNDSIDH